MNRILLAQALKLGPDSSNYRDLLSSSRMYGLTSGTQKASDVSLTDLGDRATTETDAETRSRAVREASMKPTPFARFYSDFNQSAVPSTLSATMVSDYEVPESSAGEATEIALENGRFVGIIQMISGKERVMLDSELANIDPITRPDSQSSELDEDQGDAEDRETDDQMDTYDDGASDDDGAEETEDSVPPTKSKPIFVGHGKNKKPLSEVTKLLDGLKIPYKVAVAEPNLGRPIPQKVKEVMDECGSAILIFTKDELLYDDQGGEVWRPNENVVYELGAASFAYGNRIVIFKEDGVQFPTNFDSVGRIQFGEGEPVGAKTVELLNELIGLGLVTITPT